MDTRLSDMNNQEQELVFNTIKQNDDFRFGVVCKLASVLSPPTSFEEDEIKFCIAIADRMVDVIRPYDIARLVALHDPDLKTDTIFNEWVAAAKQLG